MNILVTGGLGFIGSNFIRHLFQTQNCKITNLDKQTYAGNPENLKGIEGHSRYRWIKGDIQDVALVETVMKEVDIVVHFAAETHVDRSILNASDFLDTNIIGTFVLLEAARKNKISRFLYISTDEVYGSVLQGEANESDRLAPSSPYASSKASADLLAQSYYVTYQLPVIITRCSNNFGPYQYPEKALSLLITNAIENTPFPLYGNGLHVRNWLYVLDHVKALSLIMQKGGVGEIYNIGGSFEMTNRELFFKILDLMQKSSTLIQEVKDRPGHDQRYSVNCEKLNALGWRPETSCQRALEETIYWYRNNHHWWSPIKHGDSFKSYYKKQYGDRL